MLQCTVDLRSLVCHLYQEKNDLVSRLNNICETMENTDPLIERVRLKIQWMDEKETSIKRIEKHVRCIKRLIQEPRLPEMGHPSWGYTEKGDFNSELTAKLNKQLSGKIKTKRHTVMNSRWAKHERSFDPATMELPSVSLSFLPADYEHTPDDYQDTEEWKACEDGLFRGRKRSDQDLAAMLAWLEE